MIRVVILGKTGVEFGGMVEDLESKVEILLPGNHGDEALGVEPLGPGFDRGCDGVGLEEGLVGIDGGELTETRDSVAGREKAVVRLA